MKKLFKLFKREVVESEVMEQELGEVVVNEFGDVVSYPEVVYDIIEYPVASETVLRVFGKEFVVRRKSLLYGW